MNADTIKSFLVSLGFDVDESGAQRFDAALKGATANAIKAGLAIEGAALSVVGFTAKIADGLDKLYWSSQRTGASVQGIKALGYSVAQMGGNVQAATSSLEGLARFLRSSPGAEGFLNRLGVQTRDASGKMRDTADIFTGVGEKLNSMPVYRAKQFAQMQGIDEDTLLTMRRGLAQASSEYALTVKKIGFNADDAAKKSNTFISSLTRLTMTLGLARDKIGSNLAGGLASGIDDLRKQLLDNWPKIEAVLTKVIKGVLWAASALNRVLWRTGQAISGVIDWFNKLDPATQQLIELFGGLLVAWRLLNTAFLSSPVGIILSLIAAIGLLWEDYQTWKEGGKSLIDWGKWKPEIDAAIKLAGDLQKTISDLTTALAKLLGIDPKSWSLKWDFSNFISQMGEFSKMLDMIADLLNAIKDGNWAAAAKVGKKLWQQGDDKPDALPAVTRSAESTRKAIIDWYQTANDQVNRFLPVWLGGSTSAPTVQGDNIQPGIPGNEPVQHAQSARRRNPQIDELNRAQDKTRSEASTWHERGGGLLGKIADGIAKIGNGLFPPADAAEIPPSLVYASGEVIAERDAPRGIRNNNPGNIDYRGQAGARLERPGGRFAKFETAYDGLKALSRQLMRYYEGKTTGKRLRTIQDIISTWAPGNENNTGAYIAQISKSLNVSPNAVLNLKDPQVLSSLMNGIITHENGRNPYPSELVRAAAGGAPSRTIQQETTINIHGVSDPGEAARLTVDRQQSVNAQVVQQVNTGPA